MKNERGSLDLQTVAHFANAHIGGIQECVFRRMVMIEA